MNDWQTLVRENTRALLLLLAGRSVKKDFGVQGRRCDLLWVRVVLSCGTWVIHRLLCLGEAGRSIDFVAPTQTLHRSCRFCANYFVYTQLPVFFFSRAICFGNLRKRRFSRLDVIVPHSRPTLTLPYLVCSGFRIPHPQTQSMLPLCLVSLMFGYLGVRW